MSGAGTITQRAPAPGTVLCGKYRVERELGSGGMGTVVVARHLKLDCLVAIKLVPASTPGDPYLSARFLREARAMARLSSEHVVRVLDLDETPDGGPVLVMELLEGEDLERRLAAGPLPPGLAVSFTLQACAALAEAHARGIVHRDVKPANLFVARRLDGREQVKLLDFGISKVSGEDVRLTHTALGLGSPLFMSPEQLLSPSRVDRRTDVWSLGVTLYRLLSGQAPYPAKDLTGLAAQIASQPPTPLLAVAPAVDPGLAAVVMRCLEKDVAARWSSARALAEALEPFRDVASPGSAAAVREAEAFGVAAAAKAPLPEPEPVVTPSPVGGRTLSHDVPRVEVPLVAALPAARAASAAPGASPAPEGGRPVSASPFVTAPARASPAVSSAPAVGEAAPPRRSRALVAGVALVLVGFVTVLGWPTRGPEVAAPRPPVAAAADPVAVPPTPPVAVTPGASSAPPEVAVAPPTVTAPRGPEPAPRRTPADGGVARVGRTTEAPRNPADLEIKE